MANSPEYSEPSFNKLAKSSAYLLKFDRNMLKVIFAIQILTKDVQTLTRLNLGND